MENLLDKLFESTAKARLLKLFLMNPDGQFTVADIIKQTQSKEKAIKKELAKLLRLRLVQTKSINIPDIKVKKLNRLMSILSKKKTVKKKKLIVRTTKKFREKGDNANSRIYNNFTNN